MRLALVLTAALIGGCSSGSSGASSEMDADAPVVDAGPPPTYAPTYSAIWNEILQPHCAVVFCHAASADYLILPNEMGGYAALVDAAAQGPLCAPTGLLRVDPYHPETSLMYLKVTNPPCGMMMPAEGAGLPLNSRQTQQIHDWIEAGAPFD